MRLIAGHQVTPAAGPGGADMPYHAMPYTPAAASSQPELGTYRDQPPVSSRIDSTESPTTRDYPQVDAAGMHAGGDQWAYSAAPKRKRSDVHDPNEVAPAIDWYQSTTGGSGATTGDQYQPQVFGNNHHDPAYGYVEPGQEWAAGSAPGGQYGGFDAHGPPPPPYLGLNTYDTPSTSLPPMSTFRGECVRLDVQTGCNCCNCCFCRHQDRRTHSLPPPVHTTLPAPPTWSARLSLPFTAQVIVTTRLLG